MKRLKQAVAVAVLTIVPLGTVAVTEQASHAGPTHSNHDTTWGCPGC